MNVNAIQIKTISIGDKYLDEAIQLWRINSDTLGFMPKGAFEQAATAKTLFGAVDQNDHLLGYVLFRRSRGGIKIAHLCVKSDARGQGTARMLVEYITKQYSDTSGLGLWCRDDYAANKMWPHLGFSPRARRRGRGSEGGELVLWFKDHANPISSASSLTATGWKQSWIRASILTSSMATNRQREKSLGRW